LHHGLFELLKCFCGFLSPFEPILLQETCDWGSNEFIALDEFQIIPGQAKKTMQGSDGGGCMPRFHALNFFRVNRNFIGTYNMSQIINLLLAKQSLGTIDI